MLPFLMGSPIMSGLAGGAASGGFNWGGLGSLLGGAGLFAQGAGSLFGGGNIDHSEIRDWKRYYTYETPKWIRGAGEASGFHPLALLGQNPASGVVARPSGSGGRDFARMGMGMQKMLTGQSELQKAQTRLINAQADQIERGRGSGLPGQVDTAQQITEEDLPLDPPMGYDAEVKALETIYVRRDGMLKLIPSEDAADFLSESWFDNWSHRFFKWKEGWKHGTTRRTPPQINELRNNLNHLEDYLTSIGKMGKGQMLQFDLVAGAPRIVPRPGDRFPKRLFYQKSWSLPRYTGVGRGYKIRY